MGAGNLPEDGAEVCFDNHWRLMVKEGLAVKTELGKPGSGVKNVQVVLADRADAKVEKLRNQAKSIADELKAALADAKAKRALAEEKDADTQKRLAAERKKRADLEKASLEKAQKDAAAKVKAAAKAKK